MGKDSASENWNGYVERDFHDSGGLNPLNPPEPHLVGRVALPCVWGSWPSLAWRFCNVCKGMLILFRKITASRYTTRLQSQLIPEDELQRINNWYCNTHQYNYTIFSIYIDRNQGEILWKWVLRVLDSVGKNMFGLAEFLDVRFSIESLSPNRMEWL